MRKKTLLLSSLLIATVSLLKMASCPTLYSEPLGQTTIPVVIEPAPSTPNEDPRGPVFNPFTAYLYNNQVVLNCSTSYGDVDVTLVSTAGDNYSTVFDTADGFIIIPISGLTGEYTLLLTDSLGVHFTGEFEL